MIRIEGLSRVFRLGDSEVRALDDIDLAIEAGEYLSVMGPSGSGKSTLLHVLGLLDRPDSGRYLLNGTDTSTLAEPARARLRQHEIGFVFQAFHLVPRLSARENIELPMTLAGTVPRERAARVDELLTALDLADRADHLPNQLSGGQRQRVAIARSVAMKPSLLLADEPTGNLDSRSGREVIELLERLNADGITLLVVTHDPDLGDRARRSLRMIDGRIDQDLRRDAPA
jgi:putative ABC transport system ATP-binding protein